MTLRPQVIAHRGASADEPEHTLAAYMEAIKVGADAPDGRVRMMSFSLLALRRMRQLAPVVPRVFLMKRVPLPFQDGSLPPGVGTAGVRVDILRNHPGYAGRLRDHGRQVFVFT